MHKLTPAQLDQGAAYLASCANADGEISGLYNWQTIAEITGEEPRTPGAGLILFDELRALGRLVDLPSAPNTYGHSVFRIVDPARPRNAQLAQLRASSPLRPPAGRTADVDGLALFDHARQPRLL